MRRITKDELPEILTEETIAVLVEMAMEFPQTREWHEIAVILDDNQLMDVLNRAEIIKKAIEKSIEDVKSDDQKAREKRDWQEFVKNADPKAFYGNMGEPETPSQYKGKYGVWPPGYDKFGNKIK